MRVVVLSVTPNPEAIIATAGKLCYSGSDIATLSAHIDDNSTARFVELLSSMGHESPLEHTSFSFGIEGVSRALSHQLVRHRIASYSQQSQRYVKESAFEYIIPPAIDAIPEARRLFIDTMAQIQSSYNKLSSILEASRASEKAAIEDARYVLPNATETKLIMTMNCRSLLNFFHKRCCSRAQWEIRALANEILRQCKEIAPNVFRDAGPECVKGPCREGKLSCGKPWVKATH